MPIGPIISNAIMASQANATAAAFGSAAANAKQSVAGLLGANPLQYPSVLGGNYPTGLGGVTGIPGYGMSQAQQVDPFVYASECAAKQPADKRWRRFQHALFLIEDVEGVWAEGSGSVNIRLKSETGFGYTFTLPFDCIDPVQWFAEHIMQMEFPNAPHAT